MTAAVIPLHPHVNPAGLGLPAAFREARFCSGVGQYHSPNALQNPRQLETITGRALVAMLNYPQRVDKAAARWVIFSPLLSRRAEEQRQQGSFYALWADLDDNPPPLQDAADTLAERLGATVLAFTSRSATEGRQKARLIVPLAEPCPGDRFEACQRILNDRLAAAGIIPDRATERANQVCYLPNAGEFYATAVGQDVLALGGFDWQEVFADELAACDRAEEERQADLKRQQAEARRKLAERRATGQVSPIDAYNATYPLSLVLEAYGYTSHGGRWLSPLSESGSPGVTITKDGVKWHTSHESDRDAGLPEWGDAFDLYCHFEHGGDRNAALKAVGDMLTTEDGRTLAEHNLDRWREGQVLAVLDVLEDLDAAEAENGAPRQGEDVPKRRGFGFTPVSELVRDLPPVSWLVRGYVEADSLALVYGEPGHGKSFLAIDLAASVATGTPWHGNATKAGAVFYIAGEGHNGLARRLRAWSDARGVDLEEAPLFVSQRSISLTDPAKALEVLKAVDALAEQAGQPPALIVVDTLARNFGGDENSATDMGAFIANLDALRQRWRATVLVVHHSGKDSAKGARGSTALRGAVDAEYRLAKASTGLVSLESSKMKDAELPRPLAFTLESVRLPVVEEDGAEVWSCVLVPTDTPEAPPAVEPLGKNQRLALEALRELAEGREPDEWKGVRLPVARWRKAVEERLHRKAFYDAKTGLAKRGLVTLDGEEVIITT